MDSRLTSQRPAAAQVRGGEERGGGEARSAVPGHRQSGVVPGLCHRRNTQTTRPGSPEQEGSPIIHFTSCPRGYPASGTQHRTTG